MLVALMIGSIERVLAALNQAEVRYLVVGGVAVVLHGHLRTTADLDLVVQLEPANAQRAVTALAALGFRPKAPVSLAVFADAAERARLIRQKGLTVLSLWCEQDPGFEVDLFVAEPFAFDAVYARAVRVPLDAIDATVIGLEDLIDLKAGAGRPRDQEDLEALKALRAAHPEPEHDR